MPTRIIAVALASILGACAMSHELPEPADVEPDVDVCADPGAFYATCQGCHEEAATPDGWRSPCGDEWGRRAFVVLFTQGRSADVPEHTAPYELAERCFCRYDEPGSVLCRSVCAQ